MPMPAIKPIGSPAATDLGLGDMLGQQVNADTEELRKKRMLQQQMGQMGAANMSLFGVSGGYGV